MLCECVQIKINDIIANKIADNLCNKDDKTFWREIENVTNSKVKFPSWIGDVHESNAVAGMWKEHCSSIFNAFKGSNCTELHAELCDAHYVFDRSMSVSPSKIMEIINDLPCNKSPGLDDLTSEHLKYASSQLSVLLSILGPKKVNSFWSHQNSKLTLCRWVFFLVVRI